MLANRTKTFLRSDKHSYKILASSRWLQDVMRNVQESGFSIPTWQGDAGSWSLPSQKRFIEALISGVGMIVYPTPLMIFRDSNGQDIFVDGRQRISAIKSFMNNEFAITQEVDKKGRTRDGLVELLMQLRKEDEDGENEDEEHDGYHKIQVFYSQVPPEFEGNPTYRVFDKVQQRLFDNELLLVATNPTPLADDVMPEIFDRTRYGRRTITQ